MEIGDFAVNGILFVLFVMGIATFWGNYAPVNLPGTENYTFVSNVQTIAGEINGTSSDLVTKTEELQADSNPLLGFAFALVEGGIEIIKLPLTIMVLLFSLLSDFFVLLGVPSWASTLIFGAIGVSVAFFILSVIVKYKTK
jgi:hypothetical protein